MGQFIFRQIKRVQFLSPLLFLFSALFSENFLLAKKAKTIAVDELDIFGLIQKPQAHYILNRSDVFFEQSAEEFPALERLDQQVMDPVFDVD